MPNLFKDDLSRILTNSPLLAFINTTGGERLSQNPDYATWEQFSDCSMGCRAQAMQQTASEGFMRFGDL